MLLTFAFTRQFFGLYEFVELNLLHKIIIDRIKIEDVFFKLKIMVDVMY